MTTRDTFGRDLSLWLREEGEHRVPDHLAEVLVQSAATRQRPWWSSLERWLPMDTVAVGRPLNLRPLAIMLLVVGALALAAVAALWVASQRPTTYFGLAENGRIFVIDGQTLKSYASGGADQQVVQDLPASAIAPSISPDGRSVACILDSLARLDILEVESGTTTTIPLSGVVGVGGPVLVAGRDDRPVQHVRWTAGTCRDGEVGRDGGARDRHQHAECRRPYRTVASGLVADGGSGRLRCRDAGRGGRRHRICGPPDGGDLHAVGPDRVETYSVAWSDPSVDRLVLATNDPVGAWSRSSICRAAH